MKSALGSVETAFRLSGTSPRDVIAARAASIGRSASTARLMLRGRLAQFDGDVTRSIALLCRALAAASPDERPLVVDLLAPLYAMRNDVPRMCLLLSGSTPSGPFLAPHTALWSVAESMRGDFDAARALRRTAREQLSGCLDAFLVGRTLQRVALSAYQCGDADEASAASLESAASFRKIRAFRAAAASYSVAYSVHHTMTGDVDLAYKYAQMSAEAARKFGDTSYETGSLVAQYALSAEAADDVTLRRLKTLLARRPLPEQYRERFASGVADLLQIGWASDFTGLRAAATILGDAPGRSPAEQALCVALRCLAEVALGEAELARRTSRVVLSRTDLQRCRGLPPHELRYLRIARILAGSACIVLGDLARGRKTLDASFIRTSPDGGLALALRDASPWANSRRATRGYALLVTSVRHQANQRGSNPLTKQESDVLHLLADGKSAPQIAFETNRSVHTIRAHTRSIIAKFSVHGRLAAIRYARDAGFLP